MVSSFWPKLTLMFAVQETFLEADWVLMLFEWNYIRDWGVEFRLRSFLCFDVELKQLQMQTYWGNELLTSGSCPGLRLECRGFVKGKATVIHSHCHFQDLEVSYWWNIWSAWRRQQPKQWATIWLWLQPKIVVPNRPSSWSCMFNHIM